MTAILSVFHQHETGWHTFTSPQLPGLFLCGPDADAPSLSDVLPATIRALIEAAEGRAVLIRRAESYRSRTGPGHNITGHNIMGHNIAVKDVLHFVVTSVETEAPNLDASPKARRNNDGKAPRRNRQG